TALQFASKFRQPPVCIVRIALGIIARLLGRATLVAHCRLALLKFGDALFRRGEFGLGLVQFAFARQHADLATFGATYPRKTRPQPYAVSGDDGTRGCQPRSDATRLVEGR